MCRNQKTITKLREQTVTDFCLDMFSNLLKVDVSYYTDVKKMMRLGNSTAARPLLIQFRDRIIKNQIMESLSKLKGTNKTYNKLIFAHDLTPREREDCKNLVADVKKQEEEDSSGEFIYRVRGVPGKFAVVKLRKSARRQ